MNRREWIASLPALALGLLWPRDEDETDRDYEHVEPDFEGIYDISQDIYEVNGDTYPFTVFLKKIPMAVTHFDERYVFLEQGGPHVYMEPQDDGALGD